MDVTHSTLAGIPSTDAWSHAFGLRSQASFFGVVISVHASAGDPGVVGKEILDACTLSAKSDMTRELFLSLFKSWSGEGIHIGALFLSPKSALLYTQGEVVIRLSREGSEQDVAKGSTTGAYIEGPLISGDLYEVATASFVQQFPSVEAHRSPQEISDGFISKLQSLPGSAGMGALFVQVAAPVRQAVAVPTSTNVSTPVTPSVRHITVPSIKLRAPRIQWSSYLPRTQKAKRAFRVVIGLCIALVFLALVSMVVTARRNMQIASTIKPYQQRLDSLAQLGTDKKLEQMSGLRELSRDINSRKKDTKDTSLARRLDQLLSMVDQKFASISGEKHLDKLHIFYDFRLITADFVANSIAYDIPGKLAVFLDGSHSRLLSLSLEKKEALTLTVDEKLVHPFALAVDNRKAYVLGNEGVMRLSLPLDVMGSILVNRDNTWNTPKLIDTFGTNAYVLDAGARNLLKYDLEDPTASPSGWLRNKEGLDFDKITSLQIDGSVWMGTTTGKVFHFTQGAPTAFSYQGVLEPPTSPVYLYTSQESQKLYVLEPHASRLLVLSKDGVYQELITSNDFSTATGVVVDETANKAYILSGSLVYEVEL